VRGNPVDQELSALVFDGLTTLDHTGRISPSLAVEWEISGDGTVYEFKLREGVKWHDGAPFTAADVAFTVQAMQDPAFQGDASLADLWHNVLVTQLDEHTVRFTLAEPFPSFLEYTTIGLLPAHLLGNVPADELPDARFSRKEPTGTGMFRVTAVSPDRVALATNPNYWDRVPQLEGLEFWFYPNWERLLADYEQGVIHGFHPPEVEYLADLAGQPGLQIYSAESSGYGIVFLNLASETTPFFQQVEVRQGLLYGLDRQRLIDRNLYGQGMVAHTPIPPMMWAYDESVRQYGYDPERAIGLLDESEWLDSNGDRVRDREGTDLAFTLLVADRPAMVGLARAMVEQWTATGVDVTVRRVTSDELVDALRSREFDAALVEVLLTGDLDPYPLWHSTQAETGQNFSGYATEDADVIMEQLRSTADLEERLSLYHAFQQLFAEEVPSLLIYCPVYLYAVDSHVHGVQISPLLHQGDRFRNVEEWTVDAQDPVNDPGEFDKTDE
ncbi:MAG TPA: ABC transporter substrate-binding protein, partial [Anaerolineae bacterium]|nr:ABC transporter substrate-binding protein [Anaerolineae bacterium]